MVYLDISSFRPAAALAAILLLSLPPALDARPAPERTARELVRLALANNPGPRALQAALESAREQMAVVGAWPDPTLSWALAPNTLDNEVLGDRHVLGLSQPLPWFGKRELSRAVQGLRRDARAHELTALELDLSTRTRVAFSRWHFLTRAVRANQENLSLLDDLAEVSRSSYAAGRASQQAVVKARLRGARLRRQQIELGRALAQLEAEMKALLNTPEALGRPAELAAPPPLPDVSVLFEAARDHNPQLAGLVALRDAEQRQVQRARRDYFPDFKLNANYLGTLDPPDKRLQIGLALELPLNQARRDSQLGWAKAELARSGWELEDRAARIEQELTATWAAARAADQTVELYRADIIPLASQSFDAARADWSAGEGDFQAVIDAEEESLLARLALEQARAEAWSSRARLHQLSGAAMPTELLGASEQ